MAQQVKNPPAVQETQKTRVQSLGWEDPLEEKMATYSSILVWKIPWPDEHGSLQSKGSRRVGHDQVTKYTHTGIGMASRNIPLAYYTDSASLLTQRRGPIYEHVSGCQCWQTLGDLKSIEIEPGFPGVSDGKESACQCRRCKRHRSSHRVGKMPWKRK